MGDPLPGGSPFAGLIEKLQRPGRARVAWRQVEASMIVDQLPLRRDLEIKVADGVPASVVCAEAKRRLKNCDDLHVSVERWILQGLRVKKGGA